MGAEKIASTLLRAEISSLCSRILGGALPLLFELSLSKIRFRNERSRPCPPPTAPPARGHTEERRVGGTPALGGTGTCPRGSTWEQEHARETIQNARLLCERWFCRTSSGHSECLIGSTGQGGSGVRVWEQGGSGGGSGNKDLAEKNVELTEFMADWGNRKFASGSVGANGVG